MDVSEYDSFLSVVLYKGICLNETTVPGNKGLCKVNILIKTISVWCDVFGLNKCLYFLYQWIDDNAMFNFKGIINRMQVK